MNTEKNPFKVRKLNSLINLEIRRQNSLLTQKLLSCKHSSSLWKLVRELIGEKHIRIDNQLNVCTYIGFSHVSVLMSCFPYINA